MSDTPRCDEYARTCSSMEDCDWAFMQQLERELTAALILAEAYQDSRDRLERELAEARKDAERLDWLELAANKKGGLLLHDGSECGRLGLGLRPGHVNRTLRAAIDAAMNSP